MALINFANAFGYVVTSSSCVEGQTPPLIIIRFIKELLCASRSLHSYIRWSGVLVTFVTGACRIVYHFKPMQVGSCFSVSGDYGCKLGRNWNFHFESAILC